MLIPSSYALETPTAAAQIWVGEEKLLHRQMENHLASIFCKQKGPTECTCSSCKAIRAHTHHALLWITPEKNYTVEHIDMLLERSVFLLDTDELFFFVLDKAHLLTHASANKLLKTLEEPPAGYHFFLLTNNRDALIPTIRSRCLVHQLSNHQDNSSFPIFLKHFYPVAYKPQPLVFDEELAKNAFSEQESLELLNTLLNLFCTHYKEAVMNNNVQQAQYAKKSIEYSKKALLYPPQPGSATFFWRLFYLNFPRLS